MKTYDSTEEADSEAKVTVAPQTSQLLLPWLNPSSEPMDHLVQLLCPGQKGQVACFLTPVLTSFSLLSYHRTCRGVGEGTVSDTGSFHLGSSALSV